MGTGAAFIESDNTLRLSRHAGSRMGSRRISHDDVTTVMSYGRTYHIRGAVSSRAYHLHRRIALLPGLPQQRLGNTSPVTD